MDKNFDKDPEDISLEMRDYSKYKKISLTHLSLNILPTLIPLTLLISSTPTPTLPLTLLIPVKCRCRRPRKYSIQINFLISLDIYFVIDNLSYNNVNLGLFPYTLSK